MKIKNISVKPICIGDASLMIPYPLSACLVYGL